MPCSHQPVVLTFQAMESSASRWMPGRVAAGQSKNTQRSCSGLWRSHIASGSRAMARYRGPGAGVWAGLGRLPGSRGAGLAGAAVGRQTVLCNDMKPPSPGVGVEELSKMDCCCQSILDYLVVLCVFLRLADQFDVGNLAVFKVVGQFTHRQQSVFACQVFARPWDVAEVKCFCVSNE